VPPIGVLRTAAVVLGNVSVLMVVSAVWSIGRDIDDVTSNGSPATDGAFGAVLLVLALLLLNGVVLVVSPRTRRVGYGVLLGLVGSLPVALGVLVYGIISFSY